MEQMLMPARLMPIIRADQSRSHGGVGARALKNFSCLPMSCAKPTKITARYAADDGRVTVFELVR